MSTDLIKRVVHLVTTRGFRTRSELAKYLGVRTCYVARLGQKAVALGLVDKKEWDRGFRSGAKTGQRGKDRPTTIRKERIGPTTARILNALESQETSSV